MDIDTIVMENQYIRITLSPKKQIENALANFKLKYNTLLDE
nr:putative LEE-associated type III secretion system [Edwardsiella sp. EA181011]